MIKRSAVYLECGNCRSIKRAKHRGDGVEGLSKQLIGIKLNENSIGGRSKGASGSRTDPRRPPFDGTRSTEVGGYGRFFSGG